MNIQINGIIWDEFKIISDLLCASLCSDPTRTFLYCWEDAAFKYLSEHWKSGTINAWTYDRLQEWKKYNE